MEFQIPPFCGAFEIPTKCTNNGISETTKGHLRPFGWLEFKIIVKATRNFKFHRTSCHIMSKKTQHNKLLSGIMVKKYALNFDIWEHSHIRSNGKELWAF